MTFSERLVWLCKFNNYPLSKVESDLGLSNGYIKNVKNPTIDKVIKIAEYFGMTIDELVGVEASKKATADDAVAHAQLIWLYNKFADNKKEMLIELIQLLAKYEE